MTEYCTLSDAYKMTKIVNTYKLVEVIQHDGWSLYMQHIDRILLYPRESTKIIGILYQCMHWILVTTIYRMYKNTFLIVVF